MAGPTFEVLNFSFIVACNVLTKRELPKLIDENLFFNILFQTLAADEVHDLLTVNISFMLQPQQFLDSAWETLPCNAQLEELKNSNNGEIQNKICIILLHVFTRHSHCNIASHRREAPPSNMTKSG